VLSDGDPPRRRIAGQSGQCATEAGFRQAHKWLAIGGADRETFERRLALYEAEQCRERWQQFEEGIRTHLSGLVAFLPQLIHARAEAIERGDSRSRGGRRVGDTVDRAADRRFAQKEFDLL